MHVRIVCPATAMLPPVAILNVSPGVNPVSQRNDYCRGSWDSDRSARLRLSRDDAVPPDGQGSRCAAPPDARPAALCLLRPRFDGAAII